MDEEKFTIDLDADYSDLTEDEEPEKVEVNGPSGATFVVFKGHEEDYFNETVKRYLEDNKFVNISDLQDLDQVMKMELLAYRWGYWLMNGMDYWGQPFIEDDIRKSLTEMSKEIRLLKKSLGMDKTSRDRDKGESIVSYIENLKERAKEFGVMRNEQAVMAINLWKELEGKITLYENADEIEKRELEADFNDIYKWLIETAFPKFNKIDEDFRSTSQRYWISSL